MDNHLVFSIPNNTLSEQTTKQILVFRTDLITERDIEKIKPVLDQFIGREAWNIDLADVDHVLRVKITSLQAHEIITRMQQSGYFCEELPD